jgi:hypothetical protein
MKQHDEDRDAGQLREKKEKTDKAFQRSQANEEFRKNSTSAHFACEVAGKLIGRTQADQFQKTEIKVDDKQCHTGDDRIVLPTKRNESLVKRIESVHAFILP